MRKFIVICIIAMLGVGQTYAQEWLTNIDEAKESAKKANQNIILVFQGSDWCAPCIKLDKEIWSNAEFQALAADHFVMLQADFPRRKQNKLSDELQEHNNQLAEKYNLRGHFPLVVVLNAEGEVKGTLGYEKISPTDYYKKLTSFE